MAHLYKKLLYNILQFSFCKIVRFSERTNLPLGPNTHLQGWEKQKKFGLQKLGKNKTRLSLGSRQIQEPSSKFLFWILTKFFY